MRHAAAVALLVLAAAGCGSSSPATITVGAARTFKLGGFDLRDAEAGRPTNVSFRIDQPSGAPLTAYRSGGGPHTGVHLIFVRSDLGALIHRHPPVAADGTIRDRITFPSGGRYRMVVDAYPARTGSQGNFQLFRWITVGGKTAPVARGLTSSEVNVGGNRFVLRSRPHLRAIQPGFLTFSVTDRNGRPARFTPWYGALAHAIFFRKGSLDYFHTHVCGAGAGGCTATLGGSRVKGTSTSPGVLHVGVLVPVPGTWRLFLQTRIGGRVVTAPFTLTVK